jgi:hypothetical protein
VGIQSLSGHSITLSPGHGKYWNGSGWYTARPVYCSPLSQEDYHNVDNAIYLKQYLEQDGMTVKMSRCTNKSYGNSPYNGGEAWWHMAASYWLKNAGYPCSVYASYTGDCTLGAGASESSDDIRARPLASDYDNTNIYISRTRTAWLVLPAHAHWHGYLRLQHRACVLVHGRTTWPTRFILL